MKRRIISLLLAAALTFALASGCFAANYSNWFKSNYSEMQSLGILPDAFTSLDLKQDITRGEMCVLAVQAFEKATKNDWEVDKSFSDTSDINILKAATYGIVDGYPDGTFRPNQVITRQEFFKLLQNFCAAAAYHPAGNLSDLKIEQFKDVDSISNWAREAAQFCVSNKYVNGTKDSAGTIVLAPTGNASRQEAMTMFLRAFKIVREYYQVAIIEAGVVDEGHDTGDGDVTVTDTNKTMYATTAVNVRDTWSSADGVAIYGTLSYGEAVTVTGICSNGWVRVQYNGHIAYVNGSYLSDGSGDTTVTGSGTAAEIAKFVCTFVGYSYVYGGAKPSTGFDCSGLMYYCLRQYGYTMNRTADDQMDQGTAVSRDSLQVGDLVFFGSGSYANHVGMYIGDGNFVHASTPSTGVRINSLNETYYTNRYIGARRIIN